MRRREQTDLNLKIAFWCYIGLAVVLVYAIIIT